MFITLLVVTFILSFAVAFIVMRAFTTPMGNILKRIIADDISTAWLQYMKFSILVVGVSAGVRIYELEKYITPARFDSRNAAVELTQDRWVLELYRTVIETLQGIAWMMLLFFIAALIAYVIVRIAEMRKTKKLEK